MNSQLTATFAALHKSSSPFILPNAWDALSAAIIQKAGARAIATSSAAVSWTLGYRDGSELPVDQFLSHIATIVRCCSVPVSVDIEEGYSKDPLAVAELVNALVKLGVAGINLEDGEKSPECLIEKIQAIREHDEGQSIFINARTDVYLRGLVNEQSRVAETIKRCIRYQDASCNSVFVPGLQVVEEIEKISQAISVPLNIMMSGDNMDIHKLFKAGASRFSTGPDSCLQAMNSLYASSNLLLSTDSAESLDFCAVEALF